MSYSKYKVMSLTMILSMEGNYFTTLKGTHTSVGGGQLNVGIFFFHFTKSYVLYLVTIYGKVGRKWESMVPFRVKQ